MKTLLIQIPASNLIPLRPPQGHEWRIVAIRGTYSGAAEDSQIEATLNNGGGVNVWQIVTQPAVINPGAATFCLALGIAATAPVAQSTTVATGVHVYYDLSTITAPLPPTWIQDAFSQLIVSMSVAGTVVVQSVQVEERPLAFHARD